MSIHPPHMADSTGKVLPSSFLPVCAYQSRVLGEDREGLSITPCSLATPTILDGQLCYSLNIMNIANTTSAKGEQNSLVMLLDFGETWSTKNHKPTSGPKWTKDIESFDTSMSNKEKISAREYVQTLSQISHFGSGSFEMTALKKVVGTSEFMELPDGIKKCSKGNLEKCRTTSYLAKLQEHCQCIPWNLRYTSHLASEVESSV